MWIYEKRLQFPVNIQNKNARLAKAITSQLGGPDGELAASMRYFAQRYAMPDRRVAVAAGEVFMVPARIPHAVEGHEGAAFKLLQLTIPEERS